MNRTLGIKLLAIASAMVSFSLGCSKSSTSSSSTTAAISAKDASTVISGVNTGVQGAGTGMGKTSAGGNAVAMNDHRFMSFLLPKAYASGGGVDSVCDSHAQPLNGDGVTRIYNTDPDFPALVFYCILAKNTHDPDSIQGSYEMIKALSCALTNAGLTWDGADHAVTMTISSACFSASQITNIGAGTMSITANGSQPAAFNTHYDAGIVMTVPSFGVFKLATKVTGTKLEFIAFEDQTSITTYKTGAYAASFDSATGDLLFETRHDRFFGDITGSCGSSCGWSRHSRIKAVMSVDSSGNPTGLVSVHGVSSGLGTQTGSPDTYSNDVNTIDGDMTTGIKARNYSNTTAGGVSKSILATVTLAPTGSPSYQENTNTKCYLANSSAGTSCGTGIALPTGAFAFSQSGATDGGSFTTPANWVAGLTSGLAFTTVDFSDVQ